MLKKTYNIVSELSLNPTIAASALKPKSIENTKQWYILEHWSK